MTVELRAKVRAEILRSAAMLRPEELAVTIDAVFDASLPPAQVEEGPEWPGQNYDLYEKVHNAAIAAYEAATPDGYRYSASALRRAVDAAIKVRSALE